MGTKRGTFVGRNGHVYEAVISGSNVLSGDISLGVPAVVISMGAGERKFIGYKSINSTVNILTDVPLTDLYSRGVTDISLVVTDTTDGVVEFSGYVTPFAFDQPYTGKCDSVTVTAVDMMTARKDVKYGNIGSPYGTDRLAHDIVGEIAYRAGVTEIVVHLSFNGTSDMMYTDSPLNVMVAQAGFLQDEVSELDALSAICQFFGYTACCVGTTLYLYDEHVLINADKGKRYNANVYRRDTSGKWVVYKHYYNQGSPIIDQSIALEDVHNDVSVTIERAYDGIQITTEGSDVSVLLPDVCASDNLVPLGSSDPLGDGTRTYTEFLSNDVLPKYVQFRTPLQSTLLDTGRYTYNGGFGRFPAISGDWMTPKEGEDNMWYDGTIPLCLFGYTEEATPSETDSSLSSYVASTESKRYLWLRSTLNGSVVARQKRAYSHTGGYVRVDISAVVVDRANWQAPTGDRVKNGMLAVNCIKLRCGNEYLTSSRAGEAWSDSPSGFVVLKGGKILPSRTASTFYEADKYIVSVPSSGALELEFGGQAHSNARDYYIERMTVEAVGDSINERHESMRHVYGSSESDILEASIMLTTRKSGASGRIVDGHRVYGVNARPSVVTSDNWRGGYMGGRASSEAIPISGVLMEQLKARYGEPRECYSMTVEKDIKPYAAVYFAGKGYVVDAYERDLYSSTTNITIN